MSLIKKQLNENKNNKLRERHELVTDEFKNHYKPSDTVLNYIDLILKADEADNMNNCSELKSKLKLNILLLSVWNFLIEWDIS